MDAVRRIALNLSLREWLEAATVPPLVQRIDLFPAIVAGVAGLSPTFHRDSTARIIGATVQVLCDTLQTHDSLIIDAKLVSILN
jgi:PIN domain nuclease of toxin-antitoxin system